MAKSTKGKGEKRQIPPPKKTITITGNKKAKAEKPVIPPPPPAPDLEKKKPLREKIKEGLGKSKERDTAKGTGPSFFTIALAFLETFFGVKWKGGRVAKNLDEFYHIYMEARNESKGFTNNTISPVVQKLKSDSKFRDVLERDCIIAYVECVDSSNSFLNRLFSDKLAPELLHEIITIGYGVLKARG